MDMPAFHLQAFAAGCDLACEACPEPAAERVWRICADPDRICRMYARSGDNEAETDEQTAGEDNIWKYAVRVILAVFSERSR